MKTLVLVALALLCVSLSFVPTKAEGESAVVVLDDLNFDEQTATGEWLVEFYAPWCGHCKNLAPTWEKLAAQADPARLRVGKVDCTQNKGICSRFQVKGFPTIKFIKEGQVYGFKGSRTVDDFVSFTQAGYKAAESFAFPTPVVAEPLSAGAASGAGGHVQILTADNFTVVNNGERWFVMFYAPWCGHCKNLAPTWEKAAAEFSGKVNMAKLDCTTNTFICQLFEVKGYPTLKYFKGDGTIRSYTGQREVSDFDEFVRKGHQLVTAESLPVPAFLMHPVVFQVLKAFEPVAEWINVNLGATFGIVALLAFIFGFLLGRISADSPRGETRYVIPKELGPQLNELIAKKNASEEKRRAKREAREQRKKKSAGEAAPQEAISLVTSNELNTSSPRRRRGSKPKN